MSALFKVICRACGWSGWTRAQSPGPKHTCPRCQSPDLVMERK